MKLKAKQVRLICFVIAFFFALPVSLGVFTGLFLWTSPLLFLSGLLDGNPLYLIHLLSVFILIMMVVTPRWYCKWICPTGVLCDRASKSGKSRFPLQHIPKISTSFLYIILVIALFGYPFLALFDPINLFHTFFDVFRRQPIGISLLKGAGLIIIVGINVIVPHIWCRRLCPLGGLQDIINALRRRLTSQDKTAAAIPGRRLALGTLAGFGLGWLVGKVNTSGTMPPLRPPGSLPEENFKVVCLRCGNCAKACPTGIIHASFTASDFVGWLTPEISFQQSYCKPDCTLCGAVCPSGAIRTFTPEDKKSLVIGIAEIHLADCLLTRQKECDLCRTYCEYDAVAIKLDGLAASPQIITEKCVGCGACEVVCPVNVIKVKQRPQTHLKNNPSL